MTNPAEGAPDGAALEEIPEDECYRLIATQEVGRLGVNAQDYPLIFPVNFAMDGRRVVIRTDPGTKLAAAEHAHVTFEVDSIDQEHRSGWSVLVRGRAEEATGADRAGLIERLHAAHVQPWAPGEHGHWLWLVPEHVTGRRVVPGALPPAVDPRAYL